MEYVLTHVRTSRTCTRGCMNSQQPWSRIIHSTPGGRMTRCTSEGRPNIPIQLVWRDELAPFSNGNRAVCWPRGAYHQVSFFRVCGHYAWDLGWFPPLPAAPGPGIVGEIIFASLAWLLQRCPYPVRCICYTA